MPILPQNNRLGVDKTQFVVLQEAVSRINFFEHEDSISQINILDVQKIKAVSIHSNVCLSICYQDFE